MNIRSAYSERIRVPFSTTGETLTKQNHKTECDINFILKKHLKTGLVSHVNQNQGEYGEFEPMDFQESLNFVIAAQETFDSLPSNLRKRFANSPHEFLEFVQNPDNKDEMIRMGLANAPKQPPIDSGLPNESKTDKDSKKPVSGE